jgi:MIP family channel proteins
MSTNVFVDLGPRPYQRFANNNHNGNGYNGNAGNHWNNNFIPVGPNNKNKDYKPAPKPKRSLPSRYFRSVLGIEPKPLWGRFWRALIAEFVGTCFFVFFATGSVVVARSFDPTTQSAGLVLICLGQGFGLATAIFFAANVSGGHINPAVTFAVMLTARMSIWEGIPYWAAQIGGAIIASFFVEAVVPKEFEGALGSTTLGPGISDGEGFLLETIMTFALVIVVFATALDDIGFGKIAPLAIGLVVLIDLIVGYRWTGAGMNPARSLGPAIVSNTWDSFWLYIIGPLLGGLIAGLLWDIVFSTRPPNPRAVKRGTRMETAGRQMPTLPPPREGITTAFQSEPTDLRTGTRMETAGRQMPNLRAAEEGTGTAFQSHESA